MTLNPRTSLRAIIGPGELEPGERLERLVELRKTIGKDLVDRLLVDHSVRREAALEELQQAVESLREDTALLAAEPLTEATVVGLRADGRAQVAVGRGRTVVAVGPEVEREALRPGATALLGPERNVIVDVGPPSRIGEASTVSQVDGDRITVEASGRSFVVEVVGELGRELGRERLRVGDRVRVDADAGLALEKLTSEDESSEYFLEEELDVSFASIGGMSAELERFRDDLEAQLASGRVRAKYGQEAIRGLLLYGPPGTGKTLTGKAVAGATRGGGKPRFLNVKPGSLRSKWYGESEARMRGLFRAARRASEASDGLVVIFFDELDSIGAARGGEGHGVDDRLVTAFCSELDGLVDRGNLLVIGTTNRLDTLDPALLRAGRFGDNLLEIRRPDRRAAIDIFGKHLGPDLPYARGLDRELAIEQVIATLYAPNGAGEIAAALLRDGKRHALRARDLVSGAALANIARQAAALACRREAAGGAEGIGLADLEQATASELERSLAALTPKNCDRFVEGLPRDVGVAEIERRQVPAALAYRIEQLTAREEILT